MSLRLRWRRRWPASIVRVVMSRIARRAYGNWWRAYLRLPVPPDTPESEEPFPKSCDLEAEILGTKTRLQASRAFAGRAWSVTVRWDPGPQQRVAGRTTNG